MRLFVQRCLILFLLGFSFSAFANPYSSESEALAACQAAASGFSYGYSCTSYPSFPAQYDGNIRACLWGSPNNNCHAPNWYWIEIGPEDCFEEGKVFNPNTGQCSLSCPNGQLNGQCLENPESECGPQSSDYMGAIGPGGSPVCESQFNECQGGGGQFGIFNGNSVCISDDYGPPTLCGPGQISVFDSYGFTCAPIVGSENGNPQWEGGEPNEDTDGDGVPDRFNPNLVNSSEMLQIVGGNIFNQNNHIINQNNITNHNLTNINNSVNNLNQTINQQGEQANQNLEGIAGILGQIAGDVSDIATNGIPGTGGGSGGDGGDGGDGGAGGDGGDGTGDGTGEGEGEGVDLTNIEGLLSDMDDKFGELLDGMEGGEGGFDLSEMLSAPTFGESISSISGTISESQLGQFLAVVKDMPSNSTCPVYVMPATEYWGEMNMDVHCSILEDYQGALSVLFMFFWTVSALFIFFRA